MNNRRAQQKNKGYFDKRCAVRQLEPGEKALVLMPSHGNKLLARWCGPYRIIRKCPDNNYVLDIDGREAWLHMNALRKYETSCEENRDIPTDGVNDEPILSPSR